MRGDRVLRIRCLENLISSAGMGGRPGADELFERDHLRIRQIRTAAGLDVDPFGIPAFPSRVEPLERTEPFLQPVAEGRQRVLAVTDRGVSVNVPAQFIPHIPAAQVGEPGIAPAGHLEETGHPAPHFGVVGTTAGRKAEVVFTARHRPDAVAAVVDQFASGNDPMNPVRLNFGNGAQHEADRRLVAGGVSRGGTS